METISKQHQIASKKHENSMKCQNSIETGSKQYENSIETV